MRKTTTIGEAFKLKSGTQLSASKMVRGNYPVYGGNGISGFHSEFNFVEPKVLIGRVGAYCGNVQLSEPFSWITDNALYIDKKNFEYDDLYLLHLLKSLDLNKYSSQSGQPLISLGRIANVEIPLPPLEEQKKIAAILDAADALRQKNKALISKYDELRLALFLDMFGDPVRNPKGWVVTSIENECKVKGGKRVPKGEKLVSENTGFAYIKAGNVKSGTVNTSNLEYLLPDTREKLKRYIVEEGDVCITVVGVNIGDIGIVPKELHLANLTENANKLVIKNKSALNNIYLAAYLQQDFVQKQITTKTMAVGVPKLALFRIEQLLLLLPPIELQKRFAERVTLIEHQKSIAQQALQKSNQLFNSLLQKAFKGELTSKDEKELIPA